MTEGFSAVPNWVIRETDLDAYELLVLIALLNRADRYGRCHPGIRLVAKDARCSERKVRQVLVSLEERRFVTRMPQFRGDGSRTANEYVVQCFTPSTSDTTPLRGVHHPPVHGAEQEVDTREVDTREGSLEVTTVPSREGVDEIIDDLFKDAWAVWPNKKSKQPARKAFGKALELPAWSGWPGRPRAELVDTITAFGLAYATWPESEQRFVPMLSTWLNQQRWTDPLPEARGQSPAQQRAQDRTQANLAVVDAFSEDALKAVGR